MSHVRATGKAPAPKPLAPPRPDAHLEAIAKSHERCVSRGLTRIEWRPPDPIGRHDLAHLRERHRGLTSHASPVMEMLFGQIVNTESMVVLCDPAGTIVHSIGDDDFLARAAKVALQPGVNWSEPSKGTNAIGTALIDERPTLVYGDEHFLHANDFLTCSASPILDPHGQLAGVLDVTGDRRSHHQHTMALVKMSVRMIENRWLDGEFPGAIRLHFHERAELIGTLTEGQLALSSDGRVLGANRGALELLGLSGSALRHHDLGSLFGESLGQLVDHGRRSACAPVIAEALDGRRLHLHARLDGPPWWPSVAVAGTGLAPAVATLADQEVDAIRRAVEAAGGNIAQAARQLGVSRSTIYRRLRWRGR